MNLTDSWIIPLLCRDVDKRPTLHYASWNGKQRGFIATLWVQEKKFAFMSDHMTMIRYRIDCQYDWFNNCLVGLVVAIDCRSRGSGFDTLVEPTNIVFRFPIRKFSENSLDFGNKPCFTPMPRSTLSRSFTGVQAVVLSDYESKRVESAPASCRIISAK